MCVINTKKQPETIPFFKPALLPLTQLRSCRPCMGNHPINSDDLNGDRRTDKVITEQPP